MTETACRRSHKPLARLRRDLRLRPDRPPQREAEAVDPAELRQLLEAAVDPYVDRRVLAAVLAEERRRRERLARFVDRWQSGDQGS
ncbi:hypothetical protein [Kitasatospora sp. NPDC059673]|uniref:hypothetical protein n=1 Tax=Kitasatospora sp. NPDC059673 TaxID=3346901 RepID=UPI0036BC5B77